MTFESLPFNAFDREPEVVRARFEWALKRGEPRWLWPEIDVAQWRKAMSGIERVTRDVLMFGRSRERLDEDPGALGIAGYTSGMGPLLGFWCREGKISVSPDAGAILLLQFEHNKRRMERMGCHAACVIESLGRSGIRTTVLKGMHTAWSYFPDPATRPLADIDLLVDPADGDRAGRILKETGFELTSSAPVPQQQTWTAAGSPATPRSLSLAHADDPWSIDLQMSLDRRYATGAPLIRLDAVHRAVNSGRWLRAPEARTLPQPLLSIQLACHAGCGLFSLSLVRLVEFVLVIRRDQAEGKFQWGEFLDDARVAGALGICWPVLRLSEMLAPGTVPRDVLEPCEQHVPRQARRVVEPLTPATAQQVTRWSLAEHFMWSTSLRSKLRLIVEDIAPRQSLSVAAMFQTYRQRAWRLAHGTLTRK